MGRTYLAVFFSWIEDTETLTQEEKGNLIDAMILYARGDTEEALAAIQGNERHLWPRIRGEIDRAGDAYEGKVATNRKNGARGGRPGKNPNNPDGFSGNPNNPVGFSGNPNNPDGFSKTNIEEEEKEKEKDKGKEKDKIIFRDADADDEPTHDVFANEDNEADPYDPALSDDWVKVVKAYEANIGMMPNPGSASGSDIVSYFGEMGADVLITAIEATSRAAPSNPARYLTAILRKWSEAGVKDKDAAQAMIQDHARQTQPQTRAAPAKHNPALDYPQRDDDWGSFSDTRFIEMAREMREAGTV